jgi:hypothetical protein
VVVGLPEWVTCDDVLFDTDPKTTVVVTGGGQEEAA